jgi:exonuclease V gamma subunit
MIVTFADIHMLTGLRITGTLQPYNLISQLEHKVQSIRSEGWEGYITAHKRTQNRHASPKEHVAFLNMWLEKYLFCGSSCSPTANHWYLAE